MLVLTVKLLFAPLFIIFTYLIQKKFGARLGGVFMAVPFIVVPILIVIYLQQGSDFLYGSIVGTYAGQIGLLLFIATYTRLAPRFSWPLCIAASTSAFLIGVALMAPIISELWIGVLLWLGAWALVMKTFPAYDRKSKLPAAPKWDLWLRIASALLLIFTITQFAESLGPKLSGAFAMYPVMTSIMSTFNHYRFGPNASIALMHGLAQYLIVTAVLIFPPIALLI